jgi:hypothetical protein
MLVIRTAFWEKANKLPPPPLSFSESFVLWDIKIQTNEMKPKMQFNLYLGEK